MLNIGMGYCLLRRLLVSFLVELVQSCFCLNAELDYMILLSLLTYDTLIVFEVPKKEALQYLNSISELKILTLALSPTLQLTWKYSYVIHN